MLWVERAGAEVVALEANRRRQEEPNLVNPY